MQCRGIVDKKVGGWEMVELIEPGVNDRTWFLRWRAELDRSSACLIIFTDKYREKMQIKEKGGLRMEAARKCSTLPRVQRGLYRLTAAPGGEF